MNLTLGAGRKPKSSEVFQNNSLGKIVRKISPDRKEGRVLQRGGIACGKARSKNSFSNLLSFCSVLGSELEYVSVSCGAGTSYQRIPWLTVLGVRSLKLGRTKLRSVCTPAGGSSSFPAWGGCSRSRTPHLPPSPKPAAHLLQTSLLGPAHHPTERGPVGHIQHQVLHSH